MFNVLFWMIYIVATVFFLMDFAKAKPEMGKTYYSMFNTGMVIASICILAIVGKVSFFLADFEIFSQESAAVLIATTFFMLFIRKIVDVLVIGFMGYFFSTDNSLEKKFKPYVVINNPNPEAKARKVYATSTLRTIHTVIFLFCILFAALCSAFPGVANSRVSFFVAKWSSIPAKMVGSGLERFGFMIFVLMTITFWIMLIKYLLNLYSNCIKLMDKDYEKIKPIRNLRYFLILFFVVRKVFDYILFDFTWRNIWQDLLFWGIIAGVCVLVSFLWWFRCERYSIPKWNIW